MLSIIIAPADAAQIYTPAKEAFQSNKINPFDGKIIEAVRNFGPENAWRIVNWLADGEGIRDRSENRALRAELMRRIDWLKHKKILFGHGRHGVGITSGQS
jgi:hypothetical protein